MSDYKRFDNPPSDPPPQYAEAVQQDPAPEPVPDTIIIVNNYLGPRPMMLTCPSCHEKRLTTLDYQSNGRTHTNAILLGITVGLCCIPYFFNSCKSANHLCSNCGAYLGTYSEG